MRIVIARSAAEMESLRAGWNSLYRSARATVFQSFAWNCLAAKVFCHAEQPYVVHAASGAGEAIVPAVLARDGTLITFLGEMLFDYRDVLSAGDGESLTSAWREIANLRQQLWVTGIRGKSEIWQAFEPRIAAQAPFVGQSSADAFAQEHAHAARLLRRLARKGTEVRQHSGDESSVVRAIYENKSRQLASMDNNLFADPRRIDFMVAAAALDPAATEIFTLESSGALIAGLVTLRDDQRRCFYTVYYDRAWADWSPGTALIYEITRRSLGAGLVCDYMTGNQSHKLRFATGSIPLWRVDASATELDSVVAGFDSNPWLAA